MSDTSVPKVSVRHLLLSNSVQTNTLNTGRLHELDGLRGWASLMVLLSHVVWEIAGARYHALRNPFLGFFLDGNFAVQVFFILSGEALSYSFIAGGTKASIFRLAVKRYPRLTIPIVSASAIVFILFHIGCIYNREAGMAIGSNGWLGSFLRMPLSFDYYLYYSFVGVYAGTTPEHAIIPFAWTMREELFGSILVFACLFIMTKLRRPWIFVFFTIAIMLCVPRLYNLVGFLIGVVFAGLRARGVFEHLARFKNTIAATTFLIVASAFLEGFAHWADMQSSLPPVLATIFLFSTFCNSKARSLFSSKMSRELGRISFSLYLIQFSVLISFTSWGILWLERNDFSNQLSIGLLCFATIVICVGAARLFHPVETITQWICELTLRVAELTPLRHYLVPRTGFDQTSTGTASLSGQLKDV